MVAILLLYYLGVRTIHLKAANPLVLGLLSFILYPLLAVSLTYWYRRWHGPNKFLIIMRLHTHITFPVLKLLFLKLSSLLGLNQQKDVIKRRNKHNLPLNPALCQKTSAAYYVLQPYLYWTSSLGRLGNKKFQEIRDSSYTAKQPIYTN